MCFGTLASAHKLHFKAVPAHPGRALHYEFWERTTALALCNMPRDVAPGVELRRVITCGVMLNAAAPRSLVLLGVMLRGVASPRSLALFRGVPRGVVLRGVILRGVKSPRAMTAPEGSTVMTWHATSRRVCLGVRARGVPVGVMSRRDAVEAAVSR